MNGLTSVNVRPGRILLEHDVYRGKRDRCLTDACTRIGRDTANENSTFVINGESRSTTTATTEQEETRQIYGTNRAQPTTN